MDRFSLRWSAAIAALVVTAGTASCYPFEDLLRGSSDRTNMICLVNVRALQRSAMGVSRNWAEKRRRDYLGGLVELPPTVSRVAIAQQLDTTSLHPTWRVGLIDFSEPVAPAQVVRRESGTEDRVGGVPVVISPRGRAFVCLSGTLIAELDTVNRQEIARWIASYNRSSRPALSAYLENAAQSMKPGAQILVAVDLGEVLDLEGVRKKLAEAKGLQDKQVDVSELAKTVASLRGAKLTLEVGREIQGEIRLDFGESAEPLRTVGKELLLHVMQSMGASLEDLFSWKGSVEDRAYVFRGQLTESAARMLLSPAAGRTSRGSYTATSPGAEAPAPNPEAIPSQQYYRSMTTLLDELNKEKKPQNISQRGYWYQQYANKIEALPILNVDEELLKLGADICTTLRGMANLGKAVKEQNAMIRSNQIDAVVNLPTTYGGGGYAYGPYRGGGYGWSYTANTTYQVSSWQTTKNLCYQNANTERAFREQTWKNIADALQATRRKMVAKYKVEF